MVTFSVDYRSPPSGLGQIIHPNGDMELVHYDGCSYNNYPYTEDHYFDSELDSIEDWVPVFQLLREKGVEKVYDSEMSYDEVGFDRDQMTSLENWILIITDRFYLMSAEPSGEGL
jgi:hypothetical protein